MILLIPYTQDELFIKYILLFVILIFMFLWIVSKYYNFCELILISMRIYLKYISLFNHYFKKSLFAKSRRKIFISIYLLQKFIFLIKIQYTKIINIQ